MFTFPVSFAGGMTSPTLLPKELVNRTLSDLSQGSQVTGSSCCGRGQIPATKSPRRNALSFFSVSLNNMASCEEYPKPNTYQRGQTSWSSEELSARGLRELLCYKRFEIQYVILMDYGWLVR